MPSQFDPILTFAARSPGVAYPIGRGAIAVDGSVSYKVSEGCDDDIPTLYLDSIIRVFDILPEDSFLIVSKGVTHEE